MGRSNRYILQEKTFKKREEKERVYQIK